MRLLCSGTAVVIVAAAAVALGLGSAWAKGSPPSKPPVKPPAPKPAAALAWVSGIVEDEAGKPIAGAEAIVVIQDEPKARAVTDAKGLFTVKGVPAGEATVVVHAKSRIPVELKVTVPDKGVVTANTVLKLGVRFSGKISDARAAALAGAHIDPILVDANDRVVSTKVSAFFLATFVSGADGTFVVDGLEPGNRYTLKFTHPHFLEALQPGLSAEPGGGHDGLDVQMEDAAWVTGVVIDPAGKPVAGAVVGEAKDDQEPGVASFNDMLRELLKGMNDAAGPTIVPAAAPAALGKVTDAAGRFEMGSIKDAEMEVAVKAEGYFPAKWKVEDLVPGKAKADVRITVEPATAWIEGQVVDASGAPVPGAALSAYGDVSLAAEGKSDAKGNFRLARVRSHVAVEIRARAEGFAEVTVKDVALNAGGVKVTMLAAPRLKVKVLDPDGKIVPRVTLITIGEGRSLTVRGIGKVTFVGLPKRKEWPQPADGLDVPLPTGKVEVRVTAQGFSEETVGKWTTEAGKDVDGGTVTLKPM